MKVWPSNELHDQLQFILPDTFSGVSCKDIGTRFSMVYQGAAITMNYNLMNNQT